MESTVTETDAAEDEVAEAATAAEETVSTALPTRPRRGPISVDYSASGKPYQVYVPGDARVFVDRGVLVIEHPGLAVHGILRVTPLETGP